MSKSKNNLLDKLKSSIFKITNNSENKINTELNETEQARLVKKIRNIKKKYDKIETKYKELIQSNKSLYKGLIGSAICNYYIEYAYKYSKKIIKAIERAKLLTEDSDLQKLLNTLNAKIQNGDSIDDLSIQIQSIIEQLDEATPGITGEIDENGNVKITDPGSSKFDFDVKAKSIYTKITSYTGVQEDFYVTIHSNDTYGDEIYITSPQMGLTNLKLVKMQKYRLIFYFNLFNWKWERRWTQYRGVVYDPNKDDEPHGISVEFKQGGWNPQWDSPFNASNLKRIRIKKGYYIDGIYCNPSYDEDDKVDKDEEKIKNNQGKLYKRFRINESDPDSQFSVEKFLELIKNKEIDDSGKTGKNQPLDVNAASIIRYKTTDDEGESVSMGIYKSKVILYKEFSDTEDIKFKLNLDKESLDYDNEDSLCDSVSISISDTKSNYVNISHIQFSSAGVEEDAYGITQYLFRGNYTPGMNETVGTMANSIPMLLKIKKILDQEKTTSSRNFYKLYFELSLNPDENVIILESAKYLYGEIGLVMLPLRQGSVKTEFTGDDIFNDNEYCLVYLETILNGIQNGASLDISMLPDLLNNLRNNLLEEIRKYMQNVNRASTTVINCDPIHKTYNPYYDDKYYSEIRDSLSSLSASISEVNSFESISELLANHYDKIYEIDSSITDTETAIKENIRQILYSLVFVDEILESYSCIFEKENIANEVRITLETSLNIFEGKSDFDEVLSLSGDIFLPLNCGRKTFTTWREAILDYIVDNDLLLCKYYIIALLLCSVSIYQEDNLRENSKFLADLLIKFLDRGSIDHEYLKNKYNPSNPSLLATRLKERDDFFEKYDFNITANYDNEKISAFVTNKYPFLVCLNDIKIDNTSTNANQYYRLDLQTKHIFKAKLLIFLLSDQENIIKNFNYLYKYFYHAKNLRSIIALDALNEVYDYLKTKDESLENITDRVIQDYTKIDIPAEISVMKNNSTTINSKIKSFPNLYNQYFKVCNFIFNYSNIINSFTDTDLKYLLAVKAI